MELTLSTGQIAQIRDGIGRDLLMAQRKAHTPEEVVWALAAELVQVDGAAVLYEDFLEWPLADVMAVLNEISGRFPNFPTPSASSTLPA